MSSRMALREVNSNVYVSERAVRWRSHWGSRRLMLRNGAERQSTFHKKNRNWTVVWNRVLFTVEIRFCVFRGQRNSGVWWSWYGVLNLRLARNLWWLTAWNWFSNILVLDVKTSRHISAINSSRNRTTPRISNMFFRHDSNRTKTWTMNWRRGWSFYECRKDWHDPRVECLNSVEIGFDYSRIRCEDFGVVYCRFIHPESEPQQESPTCSLDMIPIEHAWENLDDEVATGLQLIPRVKRLVWS